MVSPTQPMARRQLLLLVALAAPAEAAPRGGEIRATRRPRLTGGATGARGATPLEMVRNNPETTKLLEEWAKKDGDRKAEL
jgi:hypothetical protein